MNILNEKIAELIENNEEINFIILPETKRVFACLNDEIFVYEKEFLDYHGVKHIDLANDERHLFSELNLYTKFKVEVADDFE